MSKIKLYIVVLIFAVSSLFAIKGIYAYFTKITAPAVNTLTVEQNTSYTVVHEIMNLDGTTYTEYSRTNYTDVPIGTTVTPAVLTMHGFTAPSTQTVTLDSYNNTVITYRYIRNQYTLTITDSNYVTTTTPSGTYYYGQQIHLVADATDSGGSPFLKWSDNETNPDYTFTLNDNTTIGPIYTSAYIITYEPNNGDAATVDTVIPTHALGTLPTVSYDDCVGSTGDYHDRQCTYVYKFEGWYTESTFVNQVNESYVPTGNTTLYAKWNKIYFAHDQQFTCTGSNYIDTGIAMFNQTNADKDFIITFTVDSNSGYTPGSGVSFGSIFADMDETGEPFEGVQFYSSNNTNYTMNINTLGNKKKQSNTGYVTGQSVIIKKVNGIVYYSYDGGADVQINNFSNFSPYYDRTASFCAARNAQGAWYRYFIGEVSGMSVELIDPDAYTLHFDANGGTGMMIDQVVKLGSTPTIHGNQYIHTGDASFGSWNTAPDGTGTSYSDNYQITSDLGNAGDVITLYAQWIPAKHFNVHFDANGGTGTMSDQRFTYSAPAVPLTTNAFTRTGYVFRGWNTAPDGTGTHYDDEEAVRDLTSVDEGTVTLYAEWWKIEYNHPGDAYFDGTATTFINTGVNVFSSTNFNKDFEIRFTFKSVDSDMMAVSPTQPTMFNVKDETYNKYPGFNIRFNNSVTTMTPTYRWGGNTVNMPANGISVSNAPIDFVYKRENGVITMEYTYSNGTTTTHTLFNQSSWTLPQAFATNVAFGGYFDGNLQPGRFFKGTLSDMIIIMEQ